MPQLVTWGGFGLPSLNNPKLVNMKSKLDIRVFAVEQAVKVMGSNTPMKDVVEKARAIETYVIGEANLPESYDNESALMGQILQGVQEVISKSDVEE